MWLACRRLEAQFLVQAGSLFRRISPGNSKMLRLLERTTLPSSSTFAEVLYLKQAQPQGCPPALASVSPFFLIY